MVVELGAVTASTTGACGGRKKPSTALSAANGVVERSAWWARSKAPRQKGILSERTLDRGWRARE